MPHYISKHREIPLTKTGSVTATNISVIKIRGMANVTCWALQHSVFRVDQVTKTIKLRSFCLILINGERNWINGKERKEKKKRRKKDGTAAPTTSTLDASCARSMISDAVDHFSAICITLIRRIYRRVRRCIASRYACVHAHSMEYMRLSIRILIGSIGYARWQCPVIRRVLWSFASQIRLRVHFQLRLPLPLSLSLFPFTVLRVYRNIPFSGWLSVRFAHLIGNGINSPAGFFLTKMSLVQQDNFIYSFDKSVTRRVRR